MLVHLPIGGLVLLGVLEVLATFPRFKEAAQSRRVILGVVAAGSAAAAACGWLLAQSGGYDAQLLFWHRWTGLGVTGACLLTLLLCKPGWQSAYRLALLATLVLLVVAGHFGSEITHGRGFLSRYVLAAGTLCRGKRPSQRQPPLPNPDSGSSTPKSFSPFSNGAVCLATARKSRKGTCAWTARRACGTAARTGRPSLPARPMRAG